MLKRVKIHPIKEIKRHPVKKKIFFICLCTSVLILTAQRIRWLLGLCHYENGGYWVFIAHRDDLNTGIPVILRWLGTVIWIIKAGIYAILFTLNQHGGRGYQNRNQFYFQNLKLGAKCIGIFELIRRMTSYYEMVNVWINDLCSMNIPHVQKVDNSMQRGNEKNPKKP